MEERLLVAKKSDVPIERLLLINGGYIETLRSHVAIKKDEEDQGWHRIGSGFACQTVSVAN